VQLSEPSPVRRVARVLLQRIRHQITAREVRHLVALPGQVTRGPVSTAVVTRDISLSGAAIISPIPFRPREGVELVIQTPTGSWTGRGRVVRVVPRTSATERFRTWTIGMRFETGVDGHLATWVRKGTAAP
jgi:hypothetical protein